MLERELGPGVAEALARTAEQLREDSAALDALAEEQLEDLASPAEAGISLEAAGLASNPAALPPMIRSYSPFLIMNLIRSATRSRITSPT